MDRRTFVKGVGAAAMMAAAGPRLAWAKAGADEIAKLGSTLTPVGAIREGNADGSIVPWAGKWLGAPDGVSFAGTGKPLVSPYAAERPLFTITAQNYKQYADKLSEGQKAMFEKYGATFKMNVFPCHRDFRFSDWTHEQYKINAGITETTQSGEGLVNVKGGWAFPFPKSGLEMIWNSITAPKAFTERGTYDEAVIYPDGNIAWGGQQWDIYAPPFDPSVERAPDRLESAFLFRSTTKPERERGSITLVREWWDFEKNPTQSYQYIPGTRRVKQVPEVAGDYPLGPGGFHTVDDTRLWTQSPRRYDWELVGKKEFYVPYNNYEIDSPDIKYKDLLGKSHANPEYVRWELHRVWVLKAKLKPGIRHIYGARTLYVEEDSGQPLMADMYDARLQFYRFAFNTISYDYAAQVFITRATIYHDLVSGAYCVDRLVNEVSDRPKFNQGGRKLSDYTAEELKRKGV